MSALVPIMIVGSHLCLSWLWPLSPAPGSLPPPHSTSDIGSSQRSRSCSSHLRSVQCFFPSCWTCNTLSLGVTEWVMVWFSPSPWSTIGPRALLPQPAVLRPRVTRIPATAFSTHLKTLFLPPFNIGNLKVMTDKTRDKQTVFLLDSSGRSSEKMS